MMPDDFIVVLVTVGSRNEGERVGRPLVEEGLAACVNILGPVHSIYKWKGAVNYDDEHLLIIKSRRAAFPDVEARVRALHSYDVPEVIALPLAAGSTPYLEWLQQSTDRGTEP
jgi:periplasmic divalent cation tolerance protein